MKRYLKFGVLCVVFSMLTSCYMRMGNSYFIENDSDEIITIVEYGSDTLRKDLQPDEVYPLQDLDTIFHLRDYHTFEKLEIHKQNSVIISVTGESVFYHIIAQTKSDRGKHTLRIE
jgi:hypothetical protein